MQVIVRSDSVEISGYVNAIERNSKPLISRIGRFVERIKKGAFSRAIKRNENIRILLNHDPSRDLGGTKDGNLELHEDNIGLHARATITDQEVINKARNGELVGWSFGFEDMPGGVDEAVDEETKLPLRMVKDLLLSEVSILDNTRTPAYDGTLIMARSEDVTFYGEAFLDDVEIRDVEIRETDPEPQEEQPQQAPEPEADKPIDYSEWEEMIEEMRR